MHPEEDSPVEIPGSEFTIDVDTVIMSLGTSPNPLISSTTIGLDVNKRKCIIADEEFGKTSKEGVYAGGDAVTGAATVILAREQVKQVPEVSTSTLRANMRNK